MQEKLVSPSAERAEPEVRPERSDVSSSASVPKDDRASCCEEAPIAAAEASVEEFGGPQGLEPTRYGDWERKGRCIDF